MAKFKQAVLKQVYALVCSIFRHNFLFNILQGNCGLVFLHPDLFPWSGFSAFHDEKKQRESFKTLNAKTGNANRRWINNFRPDRILLVAVSLGLKLGNSTREQTPFPGFVGVCSRWIKFHHKCIVFLCSALTIRINC